MSTVLSDGILTARRSAWPLGVRLRMHRVNQGPQINDPVDGSLSDYAPSAADQAANDWELH
jgi:hypothetical protein